MNQRYYSLDVFRGATVAFMILVNNQAGASYAPLDHAVWHGCTPTDLVFPFFLFAVGNAMAFVMPRLQQGSTGVFLQKVFKRAALIFLIGLFLNWSPFFRWNGDSLVVKGWTWVNPVSGAVTGIRILGVLQRIALCYLFASLLLYFFKPRMAYVISAVILLLYWVLCFTLGSSADPYSITGYFGTAIDIKILGEPHMYHGEGMAFDPEGITSTLPAIVQVVAGYFAGRYIQQNGKSWQMVSHLFIAGCILVFAGFCWDLSFPINKKIWTSSYVLYTSGLGILTLAMCIYCIEFKEWRGAWSRFFDVFGKNPLFIFVLSGFLPRVLALLRIPNGLNSTGNAVYTSPFGWFYLHICKPAFNNPKNASLLYAISLVLLYWSIGYIMHKRKIYIRV
ncbi:acyltransferase family protein [Foetidibacter luteolus]|uniref:acyltransferase family protein n=1 Tax=Foetidibacter luteolus TaxID=2608880 RepID=UPI00129BB381|nr:DUF5009 domain-containing protein [Foetidibacter luteolus]